jgi:hypothetical protein
MTSNHSLNKMEKVYDWFQCWMLIVLLLHVSCSTGMYTVTEPENFAKGGENFIVLVMFEIISTCFN